MKDIYKLKLHEIISTVDFQIMRVPNGFLYRFWDYEEKKLSIVPTFVPTNKRLLK